MKIAKNSTPVFVVAGVMALVVVSIFAKNTFAIVLDPSPVILTITPVTGPDTGGTTVTINGSYLTTLSSVNFGGLGSSVISSTSNQIVVSTPAHVAGTVDVMVTTNGGSTTSAGAYTYTHIVTPPPVSNPCSEKKIAICHIPPGNHENPQNLCLPQEAIATHLTHGDYLGLCLGSTHHEDEDEDHDEKKDDDRYSKEHSEKKDGYERKDESRGHADDDSKSKDRK